MNYGYHFEFQFAESIVTFILAVIIGHYMETEYTQQMDQRFYKWLNPRNQLSVCLSKQN